MNELQMLGRDPEFEAIKRAADIIAPADVAVLVHGESGTGKELLARHLHGASKRRDAAFITINCAALPESLAESELFGHRKGAFTGAHQDQPGRIQAAHGGTLFLDEIAELPLSIQAKLLRFLENGECQPVGAVRAQRVDVRIIAATHRDLHSEVRRGAFREDLFYRLNVVPLQLPPLRKRHTDIEFLLQRLSETLARQHELPAPRYSAQAVAQLRRYPWPGNIRELRNFCERMLILLPGQSIQPENLPAQMREAGSHMDEGAIVLPEHGVALDQVEAQLIRQALIRCRGNQSRAARLLGLTRSALIYRMKKHALN